MKSAITRKTLASLGLATLTLGVGVAQAEGRSCLFDPPAQATTPLAGNFAPQGHALPPEARQHMARIEMALRNGEITPFEAGRLMRQQMELAQFRQGFLTAGQPESKRGCGLGSDLGASLAPLGGMAMSSMETASSLMRTLMREAERLIQEKSAAEGAAL